MIRIIIPVAHTAKGSRDLLNASMLSGYLPQVANKNAPAEAEKTEKLRGAFRPSEKVIVSANSSSITPLSSAATRVKSPKTSAKPNKISANVAVHANTGSTAVGANQFSLPV